MRAKLLLFTLTALAGFGQNANMVGLPEYGVELVGTIENPTIVNNSGKTIIGRVLRFEYEICGPPRMNLVRLPPTILQIEKWRFRNYG